MAEETTSAAQDAEPTGAAATETQATDLVTDLSKVDPKALQSAMDKAVQQALRTREQKLRAEQKATEETAERKRLEEAGEFAKLRERLQAEVESLRQESRAKDVRNALDAEALAAGLRDPSDLALVPPDLLSAAVDKDGKVDRAAIKAAVGDLKKSKPYLFKDGSEAKPQKAGGPTSGDALPEGDMVLDWSPEAVRAARQREYDRKRAAPQPHDSTLLGELLKRAR